MLRALLATLLLLPAIASAERYQSFGDYRVHYNAIPTGMLQRQVADEYGIVRSRERGLLTVALLRDGKPLAAEINATALDSQDRLRRVDMRTVREDDSVYYIGTFKASPGEKLTFRIDVAPQSQTAGAAPFEVSFVQHFFSAE